MLNPFGTHTRRFPTWTDKSPRISVLMPSAGMQSSSEQHSLGYQECAAAGSDVVVNSAISMLHCNSEGISSSFTNLAACASFFRIQFDFGLLRGRSAGAHVARRWGSVKCPFLRLADVIPVLATLTAPQGGRVGMNATSPCRIPLRCAQPSPAVKCR